MKRLFYIKDSIDNRINYYHLLFFLLALPFDRLYSELILISFLFHTLIFLKKDKLQNFSSRLLVLQSVFFVTLVSATYAISVARGFDTVAKQLAIFLFPLLLALAAPGIRKHRSRLLSGFSLGCTATIAYLFAAALYVILYYHLPLKSLFSRAFINHNFALPIGMHATYLSMLLVIAIVYFLQEVFNPNTKKGKQYMIACLLILLAGLMQLSSKSVLFSLLVIVNTAFPFFAIPKEKRKRFILVSLSISVLLVLFMLSVDVFRNRYTNMLKDDLYQNTGVVVENSRADRWNAAFDLIKHSPVAGTGSGSEIPLLKELYFERKMYVAYIESLNVHNQYLSFLINSGVIGLIVYLFTLSWGFRQSFKNRDVLFFSFMVLVSVVSFSEDILDVNKGIFFYSFFFSFFLLMKRDHKSYIIHKRQPRRKIDVYNIISRTMQPEITEN